MPDARLDFACTAVQRCAVLTKHVQTRMLNQDSSIQKSDFSPVTIGDFAVQALLTAAIHVAFPDDGFLAEESADDLRKNGDLLDQVWALIEWSRPGFTESGLTAPTSKHELLDLIDLGGKCDDSARGHTWVFDPIDGTATFMRGQQYAINCALLVDGRESLGIIGCPNLSPEAVTTCEAEVDHEGLGLMIYASRGNGTWVRPIHDSHALATPTRIPRHGDTALLENLIWTDCSTYSSTILSIHQRVATKLDIQWPGLDLFSSLMKYAALGLGHASVCIRVFRYDSWRSNSWDHAGGVLIFEEAGGCVTDLEGKRIDFTTGRKMLANHGLVCAPSSVHTRLLASVRDTIQDHGPIPWSKEQAVRPTDVSSVLASV